MPSQRGWTVRREVMPVPPMLPWAAGRYYSCPLSGTVSTQGITPNLRAVPIYVPNVEGVTLTRIGLDVTTAGTAGQRARLGIYSDHEGFPDELLLDAGTVLVDAIAFVEATISKLLRQGWYWLALIGEGGTARSVNNVTMTPQMGFGDQRDTGNHLHYSIALTSGIANDWTANGLPKRFPIVTPSSTGTLGGGDTPRVMVKY